MPSSLFFAIFCLFFLSVCCADLKSNQTFYVKSLNNKPSYCDLQTQWIIGKNGARDSMVFTPLNESCFISGATVCESLTLQEFFANNPTTLEVITTWSKYIPKVESFIFTLNCTSQDGKSDHILLINGIMGQTTEVFEGPQFTYVLASNTSAPFSVKSLELEGSVIQPVYIPGDNCTDSGLYGVIQFYNHMIFPDHPWIGSVDISVGNLTLFGQSYTNITLECFFDWMGAFQYGVSCLNDKVKENIETGFYAMEFPNGFVILSFDVKDSIKGNANKCSYIFKSRG